jgi:hypothetical protein
VVDDDVVIESLPLDLDPTECEESGVHGVRDLLEHEVTGAPDSR